MAILVTLYDNVLCFALCSTVEKKETVAKKHSTCFSSSDGEDIAGVTGSQTVHRKHANVVS